MSIEWVAAFHDRGFVVKRRLCTSNHWTSLHVISRLAPSSSTTPSTLDTESAAECANALLGQDGGKEYGDFAAKTIVHGGVMRTEDLAVREVDVLKHLKHPHVVAYEDSFSVPALQAFVLVMQFCEGGDLRQLLSRMQTENRLVPEPLHWSWLAQICDALAYCHSNHVVHRDLKTSNIFLKPGFQHVLIGDFGIARVLETASLASSCVGTPAYMSPELIRSEPYTYSTDVWALGVVCFEVIALYFFSQNFIKKLKRFVNECRWFTNDFARKMKSNVQLFYIFLCCCFFRKLPFASTNLLGLVNQIANAVLPELPDHASDEFREVIFIS